LKEGRPAPLHAESRGPLPTPEKSDSRNELGQPFPDKVPQQTPKAHGHSQNRQGFRVIIPIEQGESHAVLNELDEGFPD
jgi:hypothetical protein